MRFGVGGQHEYNASPALLPEPSTLLRLPGAAVVVVAALDALGMTGGSVSIWEEARQTGRTLATIGIIGTLATIHTTLYYAARLYERFDRWMYR